MSESTIRKRGKGNTVVRVRVLLNSRIAIGPGKAELLEAIETAGSISAAARAMRMSYRRAWILVDTMNSCFTKPLVTTEKGGTHGGGARLTIMGHKALSHYRSLAKQVENKFGPLLRPD